MCKIIQWFDANALYLSSLAQNMPLGYFVRYREAKGYHPETPHKFGLASYQWLSWVAATEGKFIEHGFNVGECRLTPRNLPVDGFCEESKEAFEFLGCFFHGCRVCQPQDGVNLLNGKTFQELCRKTEEKIKLLEECRFRV